MYVCNHENNLSMCPPGYHQHCGNSYTWAHCVWLYIAGTNEAKTSQQEKQGT